jgi:hypothetical protein
METVHSCLYNDTVSTAGYNYVGKLSRIVNKVKLCFSIIIKYYNMKMYGGSGVIAPPSLALEQDGGEQIKHLKEAGLHREVLVKNSHGEKQ